MNYKKRKLNIGIDIDGTITHPYVWLKYFNKVFKKNVTINDFTTLCIKTLYGVVYDLHEITDVSFNNGLWERVKLRKEDIARKLNKLRKTHYCCFVTARSDTPYLRRITENFLKQHKLEKLDLFMLSSHDKLAKAKELGLDLFIEDDPRNAKILADGGIPVLLLNTSYNRNFKHKLVRRVENWKEIMYVISEIENGNLEIC